MVNCPEYKLSRSPFPAVIEIADTTHGYEWRVRKVYVHTTEGPYHIENIPHKESDMLPFYEHELSHWENPYTPK